MYATVSFIQNESSDSRESDSFQFSRTEQTNPYVIASKKKKPKPYTLNKMLEKQAIIL